MGLMHDGTPSHFTLTVREHFLWGYLQLPQKSLMFREPETNFHNKICLALLLNGYVEKALLRVKCIIFGHIHTVLFYM